MLKCPKIVMIGYNLRESIVRAIDDLREKIGCLDFEFYNTYSVDRGLIDREELVEKLRSSDIVLVDVRGGDNVSKLLINTLNNTSNHVIVLIGGSSELFKLTRLGNFSFKSIEKLRNHPLFKFLRREKEFDYGTVLRIRDRIEALGKILPLKFLKDARNYVLIQKYYENPTYRNMYMMFTLLLREYLGFRNLEKPIEPETLPSMGIMDFHTNRIYRDTGEFLKNYRYRDRRLIGLLFYGGHHYDQQYLTAKTITKLLEEKGYGVIPVFSSDLRYYLALEKYFLVDDEPVIDLLIDLLWFRFAGGPIGGDHRETLRVLKKLNVPILHGIHLSSITVDKWVESKCGVPPVETVTTVVLPELDGRFEPITVLGPIKKRFREYVIEEYIPIHDRVEKLVDRACSWVKLKNKPVSDKRIAIIIYNYPPGPENIGKAGYLNVFESLTRILEYLKQLGYNIPYIPSADDLKNKLISIGAYNSGGEAIECNRTPIVPIYKYSRWFNELPQDLRDRVIREWGKPPGNIMVCDKGIVIPGFILGNVFIGIQPSRGVHEDPSKIYHDKDLPPHHQYIAFYRWLKYEFRADAIIHLGTHGTLEFLPGKEIGLSSKCFPDTLIMDLPNIYIYHVSNPSESSIAKRRSYALIISHGTPTLTISGLPEELIQLENMINQYYEVKQYGGGRDLEKMIIEKARKHGLGNNIDEIYDKLVEYKRSAIPHGLYVLGSKPGIDELVEYLTIIARYDRGSIPSLHRLLL